MKDLFLAMIFIILLAACSGKKSLQPAETDGSGPTEVSGQILEDEVSKITDGRYLFSINNQNAWGIKNDTGTVVIEPIYGRIRVENGMFIVVKQHNDDIGVFNLDGELIIEPDKYTDIIVEPQFICVSFGEFSGIFSRSGEKITDIEYTEVIPFQKLVIVKNDNECQAFDYKGNKLLPEGASDVYYCEWVGTKGDEDCDFYADKETPGILLYETAANKYGVNNETGEKIIPAEYDHIEVYNDHYEAKKFKKSRILDLKGQPISSFYDQILVENDGYIVQNNNLCGFINKNGKEVLPLEYSNMWFTSKDWLGVTNDEGKCALFTNKGIKLLDFEYDHICDAGNNQNDYFVYVIRDKKHGIFDGKKFILPIKFKDINFSYINETPYWIAQRDGKVGLFHITGKSLIPCNYSSISLYSYSSDCLAMSIGDSFGLYSLKGEFIRKIETPVFYDDEGQTITWQELKDYDNCCQIHTAY